MQLACASHRHWLAIFANRTEVAWGRMSGMHGPNGADRTLESKIGSDWLEIRHASEAFTNYWHFFVA